MIKNINLLLIIVLLSNFCFSQNRVEILKDYNWGSNGLPFKQNYSVNNGIDVITKSEDNIYLYSNIEQKLFKESDGILTQTSLSFGNSLIDFIVSENKFYVLDRYGVKIYNSDNSIISAIDSEQRIKSPIALKLIENKLYIVSADYKSTLVAIDDNSVKNIIYNGFAISENEFVEVLRMSDYKFRIIIKDANIKKAEKTFETNQKVGNINVIGKINSDLLFDIEYIANDLPIEVIRKITKINLDNKQIVAEVELPNTYKVKMSKDNFLEKDKFFYMLTAKEKAYLAKIDFSENNFSKSAFPQSLMNEKYHYNDNFLPTNSIENELEIQGSNKAILYRSQMIGIGETFETHIWNCNTNNIKNYDCGGVNVTTPSWVQVGLNRSIPYMWGGFSSLTQYETGLANGVAAGDKTTEGGGAGSSCAVGVDCSGFVSRAWGQTSKYGTSTLPSISTAYSSFTELKPGDIVNLAGSHVRLVHTVNPNGTFTMLEATASNNAWAVVYNTYTVSALQGALYIPRYYNQVAEDLLFPPTMISPMQIAKNVNVPVNFDWTSVTNAGSYRIQVSTSSSWTQQDGFTSSSSPNSTVVVNTNTDTISNFSWNSQSNGVYSGPMPNTKYYWTVRVYVPSLGTSIYTNPREFTTINDLQAPETSISTENWITSNFTANFSDNDDYFVSEKFYSVSENDGNAWFANSSKGFLFDDFSQMQINPAWTLNAGTWSVIGNSLNQSVEANSNTNIYCSLNQEANSIYMYEWSMKISGAGTNKRAGIYIFSSDPTQTQRGNSYMIYFRSDNDKCQIYKSVNNSITLITDDAIVIDDNTWYNYKVIYNPQTGKISAYQNDILASEWTDSSPLTSGIAFSLRTGDCNVSFDNFVVYKSRNSLANVGIGANTELRYQNINPTTPAGKILSIVRDLGGNFSARVEKHLNIDWTAPTNVTVIDGISNDIDTTSIDNEFSTEWSESIDENSGLLKYFYCIGTSPNSNNILDWTDNGIQTFISNQSISFSYDSVYYISVKCMNNAGIFSNISSSDGFIVLDPTYLSKIKEELIKFFPNPVRDRFTIINNSIYDSVEILDINGKLLKKYPLSNDTNSFDLSELKAGTFFIKLKGIDIEKTYRIIKL